MGSIIAIFVVLLNFINAIIKNNAKSIAYLMLILLLLVMSFSYNNADFESYRDLYEGTRFFNYDFDPYGANWFGYSSDYGFTILSKIFLELGIEYEVFRFFFMAVGLLLMYLSVRKFVENLSGFYLVYFFFPFFMDVIQIRNFLIASILTYALTFLMENNRYSKIKYIVCLVIAISIHKIAIVYLPFAFIFNLSKNNVFRKIYFMLIGIALLMPLYGGFLKENLGFLGEVAQYEYASQLDLYTHTEMNYGYLVYWFYTVCVILIMKYIFKKFHYAKASIEITTYMNVIYQMCLYMCLFLPLFAINGEFSRILRNVLPSIYIVVILALEKIKNGNSKKIILLCFGLTIIFYAYFDLYRTQISIESILEDNYLFNLINYY